MDKRAEVRRILERYLVEVVEAFDLCPWARPARLANEIAIVVELGAPTLATWVARSREALGQPGVRVAMVVAPELASTQAELAHVRDHVAAATEAGVADFHPDAALDLATPARLVPFLRRAPDPLLQLVPLSLLASVRTAAVVPPRIRQAKLLAGHEVSASRDVTAEIAATNHATIQAQRARIEAILADIVADRRTAYARVGIGG